MSRLLGCVVGFLALVNVYGQNKCGVGNPVFTLNEKVTFLENKNYPEEDTEPSLCLAEIQGTENFCMMRVDFEEFQMDSGSEPTKPCNRDLVTINNGIKEKAGLGELCGNNTGQHAYVNISSVGANIRIMTTKRGEGNFRKGYKYRIKITQIDCVKEVKDLPSAGCTRFYIGTTSGVITSYNYEHKESPVGKPKGNKELEGWAQYPLNLDYDICIQPPENACQIKYTVPEDLPAYTTSVGKASSDYYNPKICGFDNGCGLEVCVVEDDEYAKQTGDYLKIHGKRSAGGMENDTMVDTSIFCGAGIGYDNTDLTPRGWIDGRGHGNGVIQDISSTNSIARISFHSDNMIGLADGILQTGESWFLRDELGFVLNYSFLTDCA